MCRSCLAAMWVESPPQTKLGAGRVEKASCVQLPQASCSAGSRAWGTSHGLQEGHALGGWRELSTAPLPPSPLLCTTRRWEQEVSIACLPTEEAFKESRRRRRPPPNPTIDQISWTCDDQRLVVSVTDHSVRVFDMPSGHLLHRLCAHTEPVSGGGAWA